MPLWLIRLLRHWRSVPWRRLWLAALWLFRQGNDRLQRNLTEKERDELRALMKKSNGRRSNLTDKERARFRDLVRKALTGKR